MSLEENKAVIRRFVEEVWTDGNYDVLDEIVHPDFRIPRGEFAGLMGPEGFKKSARILRTGSGSPDVRRTIIDMVAEDDRVMLYSTISGTHTEVGASGFAPTGEAWEINVANIWGIEDGQIIAEPWSCYALAPLQEQIARAAMRQFVDKVWNGGDLAAADQYIAPDYVRHDPAVPEDVRGIDGFVQQVARYRAAFPDLYLVIDDIIAAGEEKIAMRWTGSGTHEGELMGVAPTGKPVNSSGNTFLRLENGKIAEEWVQWDNLGLLQQLGAMPADE